MKTYLTYLIAFIIAGSIGFAIVHAQAPNPYNTPITSETGWITVDLLSPTQAKISISGQQFWFPMAGLSITVRLSPTETKTYTMQELKDKMK